MYPTLRLAIPLCALLGACRLASATAPPDAPATHAAANARRCGNVVGEWSPPVDGLRARLITSDSRADHSALRIVIELENVSPRVLEIHWRGRPDIGFARPHLDDASHTEVPVAGMVFGGNEMTGSMRAPIAVHGVLRAIIAQNAYQRIGGIRHLRIGSFWSRQMPTDGSPRFFRVRIEGDAPDPAGEAVLETDATGASVAVQAPHAPTGDAWRGAIDVPAVCVD